MLLIDYSRFLDIVGLLTRQFLSVILSIGCCSLLKFVNSLDYQFLVLRILSCLNLKIFRLRLSTCSKQLEKIQIRFLKDLWKQFCQAEKVFWEVFSVLDLQRQY